MNCFDIKENFEMDGSIKMYSITVYMSTYNGEKYLRKQIDSILRQKNVIVKLVVRDDGSSDNTRTILTEYAEKCRNINIYFGENLGYANSFLSLIGMDDTSDFYAFADQDDIWEPDKLAKGIEKICGKKNALYASTLKVVDENDNFISLKKFPGYKGTLGSALSRNRLAGCTMVFDKNLKDRLKNDSKEIIEQNRYKFGHDGWTILYCLISSGTVFLDENSYIHYRRHGDTITNVGGGIRKRVKYEIHIFVNNSTKRHAIAGFLKSKVKQESREYVILDDILNYKNNINKRIKLFFTNEINTGIKSVDIINHFAVLIGKY